MDGSYNKKRPNNPRENASFLSIITFFYTMPTLIKGFRKGFYENDLYETYSNHKSSKLGDKIEMFWKKELETSKIKNKEPSIGKVLVQMFGIEHLYTGLIIFFNELVVKVYQVLSLGELVSFYMSNRENSDMYSAYISSIKIIVCSLLIVVIGSPASLRASHFGMKLRIACCSLVYRKAIKLSKTTFANTTSGQMVNFLANDVKCFDRFGLLLHYIWIGPVQTIILTYFMYEEVGYSAIFGVIFLLSLIPLQFFMAKLTARFRLKAASRTDERIRLMNEIILGIAVIKMYTWEKPFAKLADIYRRLEIKAIKVASHIKGINSVLTALNSKIALFLTILAHVLINDNLNARQVFILTGFYTLIRQTMVVFFSFSMTLNAETYVSFKRITAFLLLDELELTTRIDDTNMDSSENAIVLKDISAKWVKTSLDETLKNVDLKIQKGSLTTVIGLVGSGKTSLIHTVLQELPLTKGEVIVNGSLSYAAQDPWLFQETIQNNILFGTTMNSNRYNQVIKACALKKDFLLFSQSDKTIIGEQGATLSGGQKARINLARAMYREADIYLLDDCLSAVDSVVGQEIFQNCIKRCLKDKTVILITNELQYLKYVDYVVILENGSVLAQGSPLELRQSGLDFDKFLNQSLIEPTSVILRQQPLNQMGSKTSLPEVNVNVSDVVCAKIKSGTISSETYKSYFKSGTTWCTFAFILSMFLLLQGLTSSSEYFLAMWVNLEQINYENYGNAEVSHLRKVYLLIYSGFMLLNIAVAVCRSFVYVQAYTKASINLHDMMFKSVIRATMQFFNENPSGAILNRFSKDMGAIDEVLPVTLFDSVNIVLYMIGIVVVICVINPWLTIPVVIIAVIFYFLRVFYVSTGRNIKRMENTTKTPVFSHLNASLQGLTTIRAFKAQTILIKEFDSHQDLNTCAAYLFLATSKAFGYWLDLFSVLYISIVVISNLISKNETYGGNVGLIISQSMMLTSVFQWGMRQIADLENQMTSVERILEYNDIEHEPEYENSTKNDTWPHSGKIEFSNVSLSYSKFCALKNLNFTIQPLQKVGIVGRTGAGKSSLITALFRLVESDGRILIDDLDTKSLGIQQLRSKLSIIPQEPVLFSGSMRANLDPFDEYTDDQIWQALEKVELKETIENMMSGLNSEISERGSNISVGQRQLVCMARALLRNNKILVLDEATANVDHLTDALIQKTIRNNFYNCTVLTIAHRLETVIDSEKILVMDDGVMKQFDHPYVLLQNSNGIFYNMVNETGSTMAQTLIQTARINYESSKLT